MTKHVIAATFPAARPKRRVWAVTMRCGMDRPWSAISVGCDSNLRPFVDEFAIAVPQLSVPPRVVTIYVGALDTRVHETVGHAPSLIFGDLNAPPLVEEEEFIASKQKALVKLYPGDYS